GRSYLLRQPHELQRHAETTGALGLPDLTEAATAEALDERVAGHRLDTRPERVGRHGRGPSAAWRGSLPTKPSTVAGRGSPVDQAPSPRRNASITRSGHDEPRSLYCVQHEGRTGPPPSTEYNGGRSQARKKGRDEPASLMHPAHRLGPARGRRGS